MATFVSLVNLTDQGIRNVKDTTTRFEAFQSAAAKVGVKVVSVYWTVGAHDLVLILEGTDEAVTTALLKAASLGNIRTQTLRAFSIGEMEAITGAIP
jgi:uncharacterized protein with GYD domain